MTRMVVLANAIVLATMVAPTGQRLERLNPPALNVPQTYSHIVRAGKLLFIAGQVGIVSSRRRRRGPRPLLRPEPTREHARPDSTARES